MIDDDETTDSTEAATPASEPATTSDTSDRGGVHIPQWLAGALVVVLALLIGAVGYAIGASSNDGGGRDFRPINASQEGGQGGGFPGPGGQRGGPGGQQGPGAQQGGPGGGGFPGGGPQLDDDRGDRQDQDDQDDDSNDDDQDEDANY